ncbi:MAG: TIGR04283 family arsenosugar biosynthesis glycosyltransferase [Candidatus Methanoperedens sp.]|nr:TIGR04283 family arsenosugar biosynthesis glycosyltransferase [Candidatus Methanoperedens sp.]
MNNIISIITPVLDEEENIEPFLSNLNKLEGNYELIFVDGGSRDGTLEEIERCRDRFHNKLTLLTPGPGRAVQMNKGAEVAEGDILLFLHVDCILTKDSLGIVNEKMKDKNAVGGGFIQAFSNSGQFLEFLSYFGNLRVKFTKTFYGDYGIFLKKDIFDDIGGYDIIPFLEDVEICKKAKKRGKLIRIQRKIYTSPRRFSSKGNIRLTIAFILANFLNIFGLRPGFLVKYIVEK